MSEDKPKGDRWLDGQPEQEMVWVDPVCDAKEEEAIIWILKQARLEAECCDFIGDEEFCEWMELHVKRSSDA